MADSISKRVAELIQQASTNPDTLNLEQDRLDREADRETKNQFNLTLRQNRNLRRIYALLIFIVTVLWAATIMVIIFLKEQLKLSDTVLVTLITTTTANFFGFFYLVVRYLFNVQGQTP